MKGCSGLLRSTGDGAVIGAIICSVAAYFYKNITDPKFFDDGQSGMIFLLTIPLGAVIGMVIGFVRGVRNNREQ
jgi:hypothetical protein